MSYQVYHAISPYINPGRPHSCNGSNDSINQFLQLTGGRGTGDDTPPSFPNLPANIHALAPNSNGVIS